MSDTEHESIFRWVNNAPLRYETWREGTNEPNGRFTENCVQMNEDFGWNDISCSGSEHVLCSTTGKIVT